jgi:RimJ/RimL family protein N-acetyltransferase
VHKETVMLKLSRSTLRPARLADAPSIAAQANNRKIWRNLTDAMPHPYAESDAAKFIQRMRSLARPTSLFIEVDGAAVGSIGVVLKDDVTRIGAAMGYWLGEAYWGRGIMSEAVPAFTDWALAEFGLVRLEATVFEWNPASARVLEKSGYVREGTLRRSAIKDGQVIDRWLYSFVVE